MNAVNNDKHKGENGKIHAVEDKLLVLIDKELLIINKIS